MCIVQMILHNCPGKKIRTRSGTIGISSVDVKKREEVEKIHTQNSFDFYSKPVIVIVIPI